MERTYIMLKPDAIKRKLVGKIISRIEEKGYIITDAKMMQLDEAILKHCGIYGFRPRAGNDCRRGECRVGNAQNYGRNQV